MNKTPEKSIPSLSKIKDVYFNGEEQAFLPEVKVLLGYYGDEINNLEGILPNGERYNYTSLLFNFYRLVLDQGLSRRIEFNEERGEPVYLLTRFAWIDQIERRSGENFANLEAILMFDVANLYGANQVTEANGDLLLNKMGRIIIEKVEDLEKLYPGYFFIPCRYGGDEFALAIIRDSDYSGEHQTIDYQQLLGEIKKSVGQKNHLYWNEADDEGVNQPIKLKEEATKVIMIPQDPIKREIFYWALSRGSVIDENEIDLFMKAFDNNRELIERYLRENKRAPFDYQIDDLFLMMDLAEKHPELAGFLFLANVLDQREGKGNRRLVSLLRLVDRALFDRLLGDLVLSFEDFKAHLKRGEFQGGVIGIEMKLIKEVNDHFSMAVADEIIKALYREIISKIPKEERDKVQIFRRGGSFFIGLRQPLGEDALRALTSLSSITINEIFGRRLPKPLVIPLASLFDSKLHLAGLKKFINLLDKEWYKNVIRENSSFIEELKKGKIQKPIIESTSDSLFDFLTTKILLSLFFTSEKRGKQRRKELAEISTSEV